MIDYPALLKLISEACSLTDSAMRSADSGDWNASDAHIKARTSVLINFPEDFSPYTHQQQLDIRKALEKLDQLNRDFLTTVEKNRDHIKQQKAELNRNQQAINQYLDHA